ncbi:MAG: sugar ABC transporter substrate-binding protein [Gaiellaceae bacterium]
MRRHARAALLVLAAAALGAGGGGGGTSRTTRAATTNEPPATPPVIRIAVVTHGQASDPFWATVQRGIQDAARQLNVSVDYSSPDVYDVSRMRRLILTAISSEPDGLVVSLPDPQALAPTIRKAIRAGIPVISINSGADAFRRLGILLHVGQLESAAGFAAGKRMAAEGVRHALCVIHEAGNLALHERCRSFGEALAAVGGSSRVITVNLQDRATVERTIAAALGGGHIDGLLTLGGATIATPALAALKETGLLGRIAYGTFGISPDVLRAVRSGKIRFAIDQQPYLQGYLPIVLLTQYKLYGVLPDRGKLIATGPEFVTRRNAGHILALTLEGVR